MDVNKIIAELEAFPSYTIQNLVRGWSALLPFSEVTRVINIPGRVLLWSDHPEFVGISSDFINSIQTSPIFQSGIGDCKYIGYRFIPEIHDWCSELNYKYSIFEIILPELSFANRINFLIIEFADEKTLVHFKMRWL